MGADAHEIGAKFIRLSANGRGDISLFDDFRFHPDVAPKPRLESAFASARDAAHVVRAASPPSSGARRRLAPPLTRHTGRITAMRRKIGSDQNAAHFWMSRVSSV